MATNEEIILAREHLGERIPVGGDATQTMFSDVEIGALIDRNSSVSGAVAEGWQIKAAEFASLVDTAEGTSKRAMSDLYDHALRMAAQFGGGSSSGVTRVFKLERS